MSAIFPDMELVDDQGARHRLWDFRNRSHVAVIVPFPAERSSLNARLAEAAAHRKTWDWLGVKFFGAVGAEPPLEPGLYAFDRFGALIARLPFEADVWKKLETEYIYHEAKHC